jgi:hypothetical protein
VAGEGLMSMVETTLAIRDDADGLVRRDPRRPNRLNFSILTAEDRHDLYSSNRAH